MFCMGKRAVALLDMVQRRDIVKYMTETTLDVVNYALISFGTMNSLIWQQKYMLVLTHYGALEKEIAIKMMEVLC